MESKLRLLVVLLVCGVASFGAERSGLRAVQLDLARQKETVPFVQDYIRRSARAGFNAVVLYLEDRVKTSSYPYPEDAESYSVAEMKEIVGTATACGVDLIPVVSPLGHVDRFLRHKELQPFAETFACDGRFGKTRTTLCLENPRAKAWMEKYLDEVMAVFPGKNFHMGFDETDDLGFCPKCREQVRKDGLGELYVKHLLWAHDVARKHGKRMWIWDDYFMFFPELLEKVPRDVVMCAWNYCPDLETVGFRNNFSGRLRRDVLREYERLGFDCVACPWYDTDNIVRMTEYAASRKCLGLLQTQWEMSNEFHGCYYPRVLASAALWQGEVPTFGDAWLRKGIVAAMPSLSDEGVNAVVTLLSDQARLRLRTPSPDACRNETVPVAALAAWKGAVIELKKAKSRPGTGDVPSAPLEEAGLLDDIVTRSEVAILLGEARNAARCLTEVTRQASGSCAAKSALAGLLPKWRALCARREAQWKAWRSGEPKDLRSLESGFVKFVETCQSIPDVAPDDEWNLELDVMMGDAYGVPKWRVEGRFEDEWRELAKGVWKPDVGASAYFPKRLPVRLSACPTELRISYSGYGEGGLCHVSLYNRNRRLVPVKVKDVSGRVVDPANLLTDDFRPTWMGEPDGTAAILDPSLAEKTSSVTLGIDGIDETGRLQLPEDPAPQALTAGYFPDRVHEFVWRNWNVVEPAKVAQVLGTSEANVTAMAASMGLPPATSIPPEIKTRGYLSVLRRNWHLLPYSQLLELLEMTPETLDFKLREEDFLWIKLGSLKPKCAPLRYRAPDEAVRRRAAEIRRVVETDFGDRLRLPMEPRFDFVRQLGSPLSGFVAPSATDGSVSLRFVYSYLAVFGDPLENPDVDPYPDGFLQRLSSVGVNGVWLHVVLRDLAPGGETFPEFGKGHSQRLKNLRNLVARAKRYGVSVFLYMNEPRAMPDEFFEKRPGLAGVNDARERDGLAGSKGRGLMALCTSCPEVRKWMSDALAYIFREVPDLGGIYAITASENLTSCASLGQWKECRRCKDRTDTDIIAEVVATLEEGVHRSSPAAKVIVSDWGWKGHGDAREIIARLPKDVTLMSVSEWALPIERGGVKSTVGEYSISAVGPGPRALRHWDTAAQVGVGCAAEIQFNNTCELPTIPYLPVMDLVGEHLHNLAPRKLGGMLIGWTMGGHPSPNFELARRMNRAQVPEVGAELDRMSCERFGVEGGPHGRKAWTLLSNAYRQYPYHIEVIYTSPVTWGAANPLYHSKTCYKATMWGLPYDDLDGWRGPYPRETYAAQFEKMAAGWKLGVEELQKAVEKTPADRRNEVRADLRYARAAGITFQSVANQARFVIARDALAKVSEAEGRRLKKEIRQILENEIDLAREQYALVCEDSRIGFEPSCQYFYLPLDLLEKVVNCRWLQEQFAE